MSATTITLTAKQLTIAKQIAAASGKVEKAKAALESTYGNITDLCREFLGKPRTADDAEGAKKALYALDIYTGLDDARKTAVRMAMKRTIDALFPKAATTKAPHHKDSPASKAQTDKATPAPVDPAFKEIIDSVMALSDVERAWVNAHKATFFKVLQDAVRAEIAKETRATSPKRKAA